MVHRALWRDCIISACRPTVYPAVMGFTTAEREPRFRSVKVLRLDTALVVLAGIVLLDHPNITDVDQLDRQVCLRSFGTVGRSGWTVECKQQRLERFN